MKIKLLKDYNSIINEFSYKKGQIVEVTELDCFKENYAVYRYDTLDWIPKHLVQTI